MSELDPGDRLPEINVPPPGPRSRELAAELRRYESPNITFMSDDFPIFWREAVGANVLDVDGNVYVDLTAGFGVAASGHRNPQVVEAIRRQLGHLAHGLGDVHPPEAKAALLKRLAEISPGSLSQSILASSGSEAVEAGLKTARLASGRPGVLCFADAYHGLTYGALAVSDGEVFRGPFEDQLGVPTLKVPFPNAYRRLPELEGRGDLTAAVLELVSQRLDGPEGDLIGALIVEPIQGRGGVVIPPSGFLAGLREQCDRRGVILIFDEILTGLGRTGAWFACDHEGVVPDLLCIGKSLTGALPFSACVGRPEVMATWPPSHGEATHTSTFLGHPPACAAALTQITEISERDLVQRSARLGANLLERLGELKVRIPRIGDVRGRGLLTGIDLIKPPPDPGEPDRDAARRLIAAALERGVILLPSGPAGNVISLTPPLTIAEPQIEYALEVLEHCLAGL